MEKQLSYEEASKQLQVIIEKIESNALPLDETIKLFEEGQQLLKVCYACLDGAKGKLTEVKESLGSMEEV